MASKESSSACTHRDRTSPHHPILMQEYQNLVDCKGPKLPSTGKRCRSSVKKFERCPTVLAEWIELKETLANIQAWEARRRQGSNDQTPNESRNQTQAQRSFAAEAWLEIMYGILSPTC